MPSFTWSQSIAAGGTFLPLDNWQYQYAPYPCLIEIFHNTTATGIVVTITSGSDTLQEESPISGGGTAAVLPARLNTEPVTDKAAAGDLIKIRYRNTSAGALTVNGLINLTPLN
jgi:hypothetical protein